MILIPPRHSISYLAGIALAAPFVADVLPWAVSVALFVPWVVMMVVTRSFENPLRSSPVVWLGTALLVAHLVALAVTGTPFAASVIKESLIAGALLAVGALTPREHRTADGFFVVLVGFGLGTALLGLLKLGLQDRGYLLWFIMEACPEQYPQGSNLCTDYNLLGMSWLIAAVGLVSWRLRTMSLLPLLLLPFVLAAGLTVGSRRFLILLTLLPVFWLVCAYALNRRRGFLREAVLVLTVAVASWAVTGLISDPDSYERFRFGAEPMTVLGGPQDEGAAALTAAMKSANRAGAAVIAGTILEGGLDSRLGRWQLGLDSFLHRPVYGWGFYYHEVFAARTSTGLAKDYPHLPVLSEGLIGGLPLVLLTLAMYAMLARIAITASTTVHATGIPIALLIVTAVTAISGDTVFSLPHWIATALALVLSVPRTNYSGSTSASEGRKLAVQHI